MSRPSRGRPVAAVLGVLALALVAASCAGSEAQTTSTARSGPRSRSANMRLCVDGPHPGDCDLHTPTNSPGSVNTDPAFPADFDPVIMDWVHARRADD